MTALLVTTVVQVSIMLALDIVPVDAGYHEQLRAYAEEDERMLRQTERALMGGGDDKLPLVQQMDGDAKPGGAGKAGAEERAMQHQPPPPDVTLEAAGAPRLKQAKP